MLTPIECTFLKELFWYKMFIATNGVVVSEFTITFNPFFNSNFSKLTMIVNYNSQELSNSLWGLAKLQENGCIAEINAEFIKKIQEAGISKIVNYNSQALSNSLFSFKTTPKEATDETKQFRRNI